MRDLHELDSWRLRNAGVIEQFGSYGDGTCGAFLVPYHARDYLCLASSNLGWDHLSVSLPGNCPSWQAMDHLKRKFFRDDETAFQLHLPPSQHISIHPHCLHIWRPQGVAIPLPPTLMV